MNLHHLFHGVTPTNSPWLTSPASQQRQCCLIAPISHQTTGASVDIEAHMFVLVLVCSGTSCYIAVAGKIKKENCIELPTFKAAIRVHMPFIYINCAIPTALRATATIQCSPHILPLITIHWDG
ncbi:unnamed protein product [Ceratitis capitata]|uniref:(Mediterranean fruit fly) hypothetical protein n=1 Tax=Ceratitis capitata TaxID=7213 RepID=A0A811VDP8_CERCA|nr:unnamed protein product [Ceratitis capitata]